MSVSPTLMRIPAAGSQGSCGLISLVARSLRSLHTHTCAHTHTNIRTHTYIHTKFNSTTGGQGGADLGGSSWELTNVFRGEVVTSLAPLLSHVVHGNCQNSILAHLLISFVMIVFTVKKPDSTYFKSV